MSNWWKPKHKVTLTVKKKLLNDENAAALSIQYI